MRTTASRCCSCSTVPNAPPRASTFSCGADDRAVTSSPLPRGSGVRSTCTGTPAARAVATAATWSLPGPGEHGQRRSGASAGRWPAGRGRLRRSVRRAAARFRRRSGPCRAVTVSSSGRPRSSPATASVRVAGSTARASRSSTLTSPASDSGAAGTTRVAPAVCAAQSWAPCPTASSACGASRVTSSVTAVRVGGVGGRGGREQHRRAEGDRGGRGAGLAAGVAVGGQHDDGSRRCRARRWPPPRAARERWGRGRSRDRWVPRARGDAAIVSRAASFAVQPARTAPHAISATPTRVRQPGLRPPRTRPRIAPTFKP